MFYYKLSRCFIIASIAELLSLATLQAMASGLPIIAANACALKELVQEGINGYLFDSGGIKTIIKSIYNIIGQDELYLNMRKKSLQYIGKHDIHRILNSFEMIYQSHSLKPTYTGFETHILKTASEVL